MKSLLILVFVSFAVHACSSQNVFERDVEQFISDCKREVLQVDSSESLENFDKNMTKCFTACLYTKLDLVSLDGEFNVENLHRYLTSMVTYILNRQNRGNNPEYVTLGLDCVNQVREDDICELVSNFEECWYEKLIESVSKLEVIEDITNESE